MSVPAVKNDNLAQPSAPILNETTAAGALKAVPALPAAAAPRPSLAAAVAAAAAGVLMLLVARLITSHSLAEPSAAAELIVATVIAVASALYAGQFIGSRALRVLRAGELDHSACALAALVLSGAVIITLLAQQAVPAALMSALGGLTALAGVLLFDEISFTRSVERLWSAPFSAAELGSADVRCVEPFAATDEGGGAQQLSLTLDAKQRLARAAEVKVGELFRVSSGERVALDGIVTYGSAEVLERRPDAANVPAFRVTGDAVFAGSRVVRGDLVCRATCIAEESIESNFTPILAAALKKCRQTDGDARAFEFFFSALLLFSAACAAIFWAQRHLLSTGFSAAAAVCLLGLFPRAVRLIPLVRSRVLLGAYRLGALFGDQEAVDRMNEASSVVLDYRSDGAFEERVTEFKITDDRISEDTLVDVLFSLFSCAEDATAIALRRALRARAGTLHAVEITNPRWYADRGVCGAVKGTEISAGTEGFLIERGVSVGPSEMQTPRPGEKYWYAALDDEVIAWFRIAVNLAGDAGASARQFKAAGKALTLWSSEAPEIVDRAGKDLGLELAHIEGSIAPENLRQKILDRNPLLLIGGAHTARAAAQAAHVSAARFDTVRWDLSAAQIMLFAPALEIMPKLALICRRSARACGALLVITSLISGLLAAPAASGLFAPALVAAIVALVSLAALTVARGAAATGRQ